MRTRISVKRMAIFITLNLLLPISSLAFSQDKYSDSDFENLIEKSSMSKYSVITCCGTYFIDGKKGTEEISHLSDFSKNHLLNLEDLGYVTIKYTTISNREALVSTIIKDIPGDEIPKFLKDKKRPKKNIYIPTLTDFHVDVKRNEPYTDGIDEYRLVMYSTKSFRNPLTDKYTGENREDRPEMNEYTLFTYDPFGNTWKPATWKRSPNSPGTTIISNFAPLGESPNTDLLRDFFNHKGIQKHQ